jgi:hypothetical protein
MNSLIIIIVTSVVFQYVNKSIAIESPNMFKSNINEILLRQQSNFNRNLGIRRENYFGSARLIANNKFRTTTTTTTTTTESSKLAKFSCSDKEDDKHYEHVDCKKYWHCLYVGTIFETALERKCPLGTMYHPMFLKCELSTIVSAFLEY